MKTIKHIFMISIIFCLLPLMTFAESNFTIITKPKLGFTEGSTLYKLGQPISDFLISFGPSEKIVIDTYDEFSSKYYTKEQYERQYLAYTKSYDYINDGLIITQNKEGRIKTIIFYIISNKTLKYSKVKTKEGITSGASLREIVKIYGKPFKKTENELLGYRDMKIYYKYNNDVLSFGFKDGILETISIIANYLPYIK